MHLLGTLDSLLAHYGYGLVGIVIMLESMGLPLPGESLMIGSAIYCATTGRLDIRLVLLVASVGAILGDNAGYLIGRTVGLRVLTRYGRRVGLTESRLTLARYLFQRYGGYVVFLGRFVVLLRTLAALLAGATQMRWPSFLAFNALGGICWCVLYGGGAYALGDAARHLTGPIGIGVGIVAATAAATLFLFVKRNERRLTREAEQATGVSVSDKG